MSDAPFTPAEKRAEALREAARALLAVLPETPTVAAIAPLHGAFEAMMHAAYHEDDGAPMVWRGMRAFLAALAQMEDCHDDA